MNKLTDNQKRMVMVGVALLMILFGVMQVIFKFEFINKYKPFFDNFFTILLFFAAILFFSIKRKPKQEKEEPKKIDTEEK